jgi:hypothetical protein
MQDDEIDQTQSPIAAAAVIQQSDLRSGHDCHREGIAERDSENGLRSPTNSDTADAVSHLSTDAGDHQPSDLWEICSIIGTRKVDGVVQYWVDWEPTWMLESDFGGGGEGVFG